VDRPAALKDRMRDGVLARVKPGILRPYLAKRDDYNAIGIEKIVCPPPPTPLPVTNIGDSS